MKPTSILFLIFCSYVAKAQELYVYTEPASNMPARSISAKISANYMPAQKPYNRFIQRYTPEIMFGINKNWMVHLAGTFADMQTNKMRWESIYLYGKYRFLSSDDLHSHFRMAVFADVAYNRSPFHHYEINLQGDNSGAQLGLIATQLKGKFAVSGTVSHIQVLDKDRNDKTRIYLPSRFYQVMNYSLSAGYLLLPREYTDYKQTNLNLYTELLAQQSLERKAYYVDLAPAVQLIFNSNSKLNVGYRFQLGGDMQRGGEYSWLVSFERTFLNALSRKKRRMVELHIKNMVCGRCIKAVAKIFEQAGIIPESIELGIVKVKTELNEVQRNKIKTLAETEGFELLDDQKAKLVDDIKRIIIELVHYGSLDEMDKNLSKYLADKLHKEYTYLSNLFSSIENTTIEQYFILQKIEKVKEWLVYDEFTLSEIAFKLGYSSVAHLSGQFKKVTGFTASEFKQLKDHHRKPLDKV